MKSETKPLDQFTPDAAGLMRSHPPRWRNANKAAVFESILASGCVFEGRLDYARWPRRHLPAAVEHHSRFEIRPGLFDYAPSPDDSVVEWHMNFADPELFCAYAGPLLAQDELQVLEHPVLGSLREALIAAGKPARTVDERGGPTPVTVTGVQRCCAFDTLPDAAAGRPEGLYGNRFSAAPKKAVVAAARPIVPPTVSNILAIAAPGGGFGAYERGEIEAIAVTAYSGFSAAREESARPAGGRAHAVIHTGFWGCGAFGGDRTLMTIVQAFAADLAGVELVYHAFNTAGVRVAREALQAYEQLRRTEVKVSAMIDAIEGMGLMWGFSNGT
jgi:hypothetical protein